RSLQCSRFRQVSTNSNSVSTSLQRNRSPLLQRNGELTVAALSPRSSTQPVFRQLGGDALSSQSARVGHCSPWLQPVAPQRCSCASLHCTSGVAGLQGASSQPPRLALHCAALAQVLTGVQPVCPSLQALSRGPSQRKSPVVQAGGWQ